MISYLPLAYDLILFVEANMEQLELISMVLEVLFKSSGQNVNKEKSYGIYLKQCWLAQEEKFE